jgi:endonuclease I
MYRISSCQYRVLFVFYTIFFLSITASWAQIPSGYYNSAQGLTGSALKTALHNIIDNHDVASYNSLWTHFQNTDKKSNNKVWDMYSNVPTGTPPYEFTFSSDQCGSYNGENDCYNREHTWPQSWFNSENGPSSDLFHVYPTDGYVNNIRNNYPYGEVDAPSWTSLNGSKLGPNTTAGYSQTVFEPIDEYKGDLARGYFYMSTRYQSEDSGWSSSGATNKSNLLPWQVDVLLSWHHMDAVSSKEVNRNNAVYLIQDNRNPFIDNPQWVDSIWTITYTSIHDKPTIDKSVIVFPNPATDKFQVAFKTNFSDLITIEVFDVLGNKLGLTETLNNSSLPYSVDCKSWSNGIYYLKLISGSDVSIKRIVKY